MKTHTLSRNFFIGILAGTTLLFFWMIRNFLLPVLLAAVFSTLFYPLYTRLLKLLRGRRNLASLLCCVILLLVLILPIYGVGYMVVTEAVEFYNTAESRISEALEQGEAGPLGRIRNSRWVRQLGLDEIDWKARLQEAGQRVGGLLVTAISKGSRETIQVLLLLFITFFTMFYFFRDGKDLVRQLRHLIPLDREYKNAIAARFASVARATVKGTLLVALVQGTLAGLTLWIFGVRSAVLWGVVATLFSIIPLVGAWMVLYPAAFIQMATGHLWQGVGILLVTVLVIVNVDNLMRPRLVGQETGMHDLMVFFSTLGGIGMFGAMGFIVGPVVGALFLSLLDIYSQEFKEDLDTTRPGLAPAGAALPQLEPPETRHEPVPEPSRTAAPTSPGEARLKQRGGP
jgi:predicted PurR-regulated permease PerM